MADAGEPRRFLSVIALPERWSRLDAAAALAEAGVMDKASLRMRLGQQLPMVIAKLRAGAADLAVHIIRDAGGEAFAPSMGEIRALGPTLKLRDLEVAQGELEVAYWRGSEGRVSFSRIAVLVRGIVTKSVIKGSQPPPPGPSLPAYVAVGPEAAILAEMHEQTRLPDMSVARETTASHKLDIHLVDGRVLQIDGDKFRYLALGESRGLSDKANTDAMLELLRHLAPHAIVDEYFPLWRPPPEARRLRLPDMRINNDDPAFAFYSRWVALMYRHMGVAG